MLTKAQGDFNVKLAECYVIGDMGASDMVMANAVGAKGVLVRTGVGEGSLTDFRHTWLDVDPDYVADNVLEAVKWVLEREDEIKMRELPLKYFYRMTRNTQLML